MENTQKKKRVPSYFKKFCKTVEPGYVRIELEKSAKDKRLHFLQYMLTTSDFELPNLAVYSRDNETTLDILANYAVRDSQFQTLKYLLESPELKEHANINKVLKYAVDNNKYEGIIYLLTSTELTQHADINYIYKSWRHNEETFLVDAVETKDHKMVEFLTNSPLLKKTINIQALENEAVYTAIIRSDLWAIKYLLSSDKLKEHAVLDDKCILQALMVSNEDVLNYLVLDYGIEKNSMVEKFLQERHKYIKEILNEDPYTATLIKEDIENIEELFSQKNAAIKKNKM